MNNKLYLNTNSFTTRMGTKGQAVFFGAIFGLLAMIVFFISLPVILDFFAIGKASINQPFVSMVIDFTPFFLFIMICWVTLELRGVNE